MNTIHKLREELAKAIQETANEKASKEGIKVPPIVVSKITLRVIHENAKRVSSIIEYNNEEIPTIIQCAILKRKWEFEQKNEIEIFEAVMNAQKKGK